jgi:DNA mismatch repair protein MutL
MPKIRLLREEVYRKIAAGEVIERPVSVVKELVENALDAGADEIKIGVVGGGKDLIRVEDTGHGFDPDDIETAFQRHATSKLTELSDLDSLLTLGFRGEALASMNEVADIELRTSNNSEGNGIFCRFENGKRVLRKEEVFSRGTSIEVRNLFRNFPVRRKFLKGDPHELKLIATFLEQMALAHFGVAFELQNNGKTVFAYAKTSRLDERIYQVFGGDFLDGLQAVDFSDGGYRLQGFVSRIHRGVSQKNRQFFFVNLRPVREKTLIASLNRTFEPYLEKGKSPAAVLLLEISSADIDVNIHPMKLEIRFRDSGRIYTLIKNSIEGSLPLSETGSVSFVPVAEARGSADSRWVPSDSAFLQNSLLPVEPADAETFRILGQYRNSYIMVENGGDLLIVDQHNARERVLFDRLKSGILGDHVPSAQTLFPIVLDLTPSEKEDLSGEKIEWLRRAGFEVRSLGGPAVEILSFPTAIDERNVREAFLAVVHLHGDENHSEEERLAEIACKSAIKVNHRLTVDEMQSIVRDLLASSNPHFCPHQRPIFALFSLGDIEKLLKRR